MDLQYLHNTLESGKVVRYHAVPTVKPQTISQHSWSVAILVMYITEMTCHANLLMEALLHDTGEYETGDIPYTLKRDHPDLKKQLHLIELEARHRITISGAIALTADEEAILKVADTLDGFIWCALHEDKYGKVEDRWHQAYLNARAKFADLLSDRQWEIADAVFVNYGGIVTKPEGAPFDEALPAQQ